MLAASTQIETPEPVQAHRPRVISLCRVSHKIQAGDGRAGLPRQREIVATTVQHHGLEVVEHIEIIHSGTDVRHNSEFNRLLGYIESKVIEGVVVSELDRIARPVEPSDWAIYQVFKDSGAKIYYGPFAQDLSTPEGQLMANIRASFAAFELQLIKSRTTGAREKLRQQGLHPDNDYTLPLGVAYDRTTKKWRYTDEALVVAELFRLYDSGTTNMLELGRLTKLVPNTARNFLQNELFAGYRVTQFYHVRKRNKETGKMERISTRRPPEKISRVKVLDPGLIPQDVFDRVQHKLKQTRFNYTSRRSSEEYCRLLTGTGRCSHCLSPIYLTGKNVNGKPVGWYNCRSNVQKYRKETGGCIQPHLRQHDVDRAVFEFTIRTLSDPSRLSEILAASVCRLEQVIQPFPKQLDPDVEIAELQKQDERLYAAYKRGAIFLEEFDRDRREIAGRIGRLRQASRKEDKRTQTGVAELVQQIVTGVSGLRHLTDRRAQKAVIQSLFSEIFVKDYAIVGFSLHRDFAVSVDGNLATPHIELDEPFMIRTPPEVLPAGQKRCTCCKEIKFITDFYNPRLSWCRLCDAAWKKEYREKNKALLAEKASQRYFRKKAVRKAENR